MLWRVMHRGARSDSDRGHHISEDHDGGHKGATRYGDKSGGGDGGRV